MAPLIELKNNHEKYENALKSDISHHLLLVICEESISTVDEKYYEELVNETSIPKKVIVISSEGVGIKDDLKFTDFSNEFKKTLLSKQVSFQGTTLAVADLIKTRTDQTVEELIQSGEPEKNFNLESIEELIKQEKSPIQIPSLSSSRFEKSLYIKRQLSSVFPLDNEFWEEVAKQLDMETSGGYSLEKLQRECGVNKQGEIKWKAPIVNDEQRTKIWEKMNSVLEKRKSLAVPPSNTLTEDNLSIVDRHEKEKYPGVVIISGAAGSGKSSILSHYYEEIKEKNPNHWVIIINFTDHSKDFLRLNLSEVNLSTTIECIINLSVVVGHSRLGRSMLRRRLNLGERITILFDGFDEIVKSQYQKTAIRMINVLKEKKSVGLYVTTRSHMANNLQFWLSQLNFDLENFSKEDQINYLTSLWKQNFNEDAQDNLYNFAELLVDRISKTLKDGDRAFIGIPLQCRILAECFKTEVQKSVQNQSELNPLVESIDRMNLDVADLYRMLITQKRNIYEEEKKALSQTHYLADLHVESDIDNLESFLRKLAIKTIVSTKEEVHVLLGTQENSMKSKNEQVKKTQKRMDHSARFGLLDENAEGKERFLHRTYAEYMMAEYLYTGFLLDDDKRNKLLDYDSARKLIIDKILVKEQYDGVQVFFNSMLKEIVDGNEEWHANINEGKLPERLFKLSEVLFRQFLRQIRKPYTKKHPNALLHSAKNKKEKVFQFFCDCLDVFYDKSDVLRAMTISFLSEHTTENFIFTLKVFRNQSIEVFQRFIRYFDSDSQDDYEKPHAKTLMEKIFHGFSITDLEDSNWNAKEQQIMIECLLVFMDKKRTAVDSFFQPWKECYIEPLLAMLILNENYENHLIKFVKILSQTTAYSNDSTLATFIKNVCSSVVGKIRQGRGRRLLKILYREVRENLAIKVFGLLFSMEPEIFQDNFQFHTMETRDIFKRETNEILHLLLERDFYTITLLHRAAFNNEIDAIEIILFLIQENLTRGDDRYKTMAEQVVNVMCYDENGFTPFYVAAARGNENVYRKMLFFLKHFHEKQNTSDTLEKILTATNGFVHHALSDAMESENLEMFQVILSSIKDVLGHNTLLKLLKSNSRENVSKNRYDILEYWSDTIFGVACRYKDLFQTLAKIVVEQKDNGSEAYQDWSDWNDLIFHLIESEDFNRFTLKYVSADILQGMLLQKGSNEWTKRLLDLRLWGGFKALSSRLIKNFNEDQLKELITMLTHSFSDKYGCYWCKLTELLPFFKHFNENDAISKFLKCVSEKLGESFVYKLVTHDDVTIPSKALANFLLSHLSKERQEEAKQYWKINSPAKIDDIFFTPTSKIFWLNVGQKVRYLEDIVWYYLDHGNNAQLKDFIKTVTSLHTIAGRKRSMWSYVFENDLATNKIIKHVSENTEIFGVDAAKTLLFHVVDKDPRYLNAIWWKKDVDELLAQLPEVIQQGIRQHIQEHAFGLIEQLFGNPSWLIPSDQSETILNTLAFMVNYSNENQLQQFIQHITALHNSEKSDSIWYGLFRYEVEEDYIRMMDKFLKSVFEKLGSSAVKKLLLHVDEGEKTVKTMLSHLDDNHREKVQRKVNKYLENFHIPPKRRKK
ncbi:hypothetical protein DAPPUDRAFT_97078 [Daphnia pulex]|uniref:NACHT domain-containing protein n=1 Tax=Daphnia pulex TaxID=6669 RepID=E9G0J1_DAPPU|nr:hypothetical protein DAPPUDRAFT_97078 [Daphnia pulex]|eukprot:EFX86913.1 hypothetical protein DAPPUDRAFT_97078 [Daphnia pulex]